MNFRRVIHKKRITRLIKFVACHGRVGHMYALRHYKQCICTREDPELSKKVTRESATITERENSAQRDSPSEN